MRKSSSPPGGGVSNTGHANDPNSAPPRWLELVAQFAGPVVNLMVFVVSTFVIHH
ncbi:hypothetical protein [Curtobacterium sp. MCBA15_016]|uniref:hypothetical protein n=1 Tax=Curtobacterium sp. MCBA15_016 TaxID=1898740 RepID=UPI001587522D|nr:hypothetical protein [Curtobacterium sp. MCBA15_016]